MTLLEPLWFLLLPLLALADQAGAASPSLEQQLAQEPPAALAQAARTQGDAQSGAVLFYQASLGCAKCHALREASASLGPDLTRLEAKLTDSQLVEAILNPSQRIEKGYEPLTLALNDGSVRTGLLAEERPDRFVLRDPAQDGKLVTIPRDQVEGRTPSTTSLMPAGLVNQLASRQQFLDLLRFVMEVVEHGPERARALKPDPALVGLHIPEYEFQLDHARLIQGLGPDQLAEGKAIYERVCVNCHGTAEQPGSLPTSLRFATGTFKNGSDPYQMYRTLTFGYGQMAPQIWMVPRQKYAVIHYIREAYLRQRNPSQYRPVDESYLARLPKGRTLGPEPDRSEPWAAMNYGPSLTHTYEISGDGSNFAYKGVAVRLDDGPGGVAQGRAWMVFEHDTLRVAGAWTGRGFIDWNSIQFNGRHQVHPRVVGQVAFANSNGPGWANPADGSFTDVRLRGRDGRAYGPLPREWGHFRGRYQCGGRVVFAYTVGKAEILESFGLEQHDAAEVFTRTLEIGPAPHELAIRVVPESQDVAVAVVGTGDASLKGEEGYQVVHLPACSETRRLKLLVARTSRSRLAQIAKTAAKPEALRPFTHGGARLWSERITTQPILGRDDGPFAVDVLAIPVKNRWQCQVRPTGLDFFADGRTAAVCTWDGDVWRVEGIDDPAHGLTWQRVASGLFQPLGLKILQGQVYVTCRDQIVILRDLNGDGETDFYENFNSDHQVTEHFHEFAMGLQADAEGNLYYAKAARHGLPALVPHHGTLLRVSKDGLRTDILATGFRAPNGVCLNGDGTFFLTDQEGFWLPKNRINWVKPGGFYGNMWGYHDVTDTSDAAMEPPVCWITNAFDRSPGELLWVDSPAWGPLQGSLLNFSYGYGKIFVVPHETIGGLKQGGMCALPIPHFPTGVMRGRFHPRTHQLYCCGMFAWAGNQTDPGGLYRVRTTGRPITVPIGLNARKTGMVVTFSSPLDPMSASNAAHYDVKVWSLKRSEKYGSEHFNEHSLRVASASCSADGRTVSMTIPEIAPTWCMEIKYGVKDETGERVDGVIHNTIHRLGN